ncbi:MAG: hypothetical protein JWP82_2133 [Humibacillus sp.]|nr:hypothetical protein [Humibacillus sp.]
MSLFPEAGGGPASDAPERRCSSKGCRRVAAHAVVGRNPKLHSSERLKVWLACDEHRQPLADFVGLRGFLIEVVPVEALTDADG